MCTALASRAPWAEGNAYRVPADILVLRGNYEQAELAFRRASELGWDPQPGLAMLKLQEGEANTARQMLEQSLADRNWANRQRRCNLLASQVFACVTAGDIRAATSTLNELENSPGLHSTPANEAVMLQAQAKMAMVTGESATAIRYWQLAINAWEQAGAPLYAAIARLQLAEILVDSAVVYSAGLELQAARNWFKKAEAGALLDHIEALLHRLATRQEPVTRE